MGKGGKKKSSQRNQPETQPQPSTRISGTNATSVFPHRNAGTGRPHIQCLACSGMIISGRIVDKIISAPGVDQDHMLHICAEHQ